MVSQFSGLCCWFSQANVCHYWMPILLSGQFDGGSFFCGVTWQILAALLTFLPSFTTKHWQIWWSGPSCGFALDPLWVSQWASHGAPRQWRSQHVTRHFPLTITPLQPNEAEQQSCNCHLLWSRMKLPKRRWKWQSITPESNRVCADEFKCCMRVIVRFTCTVCMCDVNMYK